MDGLIFSDGVFNRSSNKLLDLLRGRAGPRTRGHRHSHRNIRIFSLWHGMVAKPAPNQDANEENPGNLRVLDKEPRCVMRVFDPILVACVCHRLCLRDRSEEHTSELQSPMYLVCRLLLEKKKTHTTTASHTTDCTLNRAWK